MEQVKSFFHEGKRFIMHHKTLSLVILCIVILDISLLGVISDWQEKQSQVTLLHYQEKSNIIPSLHLTPSSRR